VKEGAKKKKGGRQEGRGSIHHSQIDDVFVCWWCLVFGGSCVRMNRKTVFIGGVIQNLQTEPRWTRDARQTAAKKAHLSTRESLSSCTSLITAIMYSAACPRLLHDELGQPNLRAVALHRDFHLLFRDTVAKRTLVQRHQFHLG
jgi:succinate dehydrogenase/fumarate reductase-like Fe-S protein